MARTEPPNRALGKSRPGRGQNPVANGRPGARKGHAVLRLRGSAGEPVSSVFRRSHRAGHDSRTARAGGFRRRSRLGPGWRILRLAAPAHAVALAIRDDHRRLIGQPVQQGRRRLLAAEKTCRPLRARKILSPNELSPRAPPAGVALLENSNDCRLPMTSPGCDRQLVQSATCNPLSPAIS
jgi:hypothetical protein